MDMPMTQSSRMELARPVFWDEVARDFPRLPIVIGHLGHPWIEETLLLLGKHRNVFAELSGICCRPWPLFNALQSAVSLGVMDRLLFASGYPRETPERAIESLYSVNTMSLGTQLPGIPRALVRGIVERDALQCLGIVAEFERAGAARTEELDEEHPDEAELIEGMGRRFSGRSND
jgi:predicted TIM-barrel fold metal-dependent hydrolase